MDCTRKAGIFGGMAVRFGSARKTAHAPAGLGLLLAIFFTLYLSQPAQAQWGLADLTIGKPNDNFGSLTFVALTDDGSAIVSDAKNDRVQKIKKDDFGPGFDELTVTTFEDPEAKSGKHLNGPAGVAVNPKTGDVYVADSDNDRIVVYTSEGVYKKAFGATGTNLGRLDGPVGVAVDGHENVYVADLKNKRIQRFAAGGAGSVIEWDGTGGGSVKLEAPQGIAIAGLGGIETLYVADTSLKTVRMFSPNGVDMGALNAENKLNNPVAVATDGEGRAYVSNLLDKSVVIFNNGTYKDEFSTTSGQGIEDAAPAGLAVDTDGFVHVAMAPKQGEIGGGLASWGKSPEKITDPVLNKEYVDVGDELRVVDPGQWEGSGEITFTYEWQGCKPNNPCETLQEEGDEPTYTVTQNDKNKFYVNGEGYILVSVLADNGISNAEQAWAAAKFGEAPYQINPPELSGVAKVGMPLQLSPGKWGGKPIPQPTKDISYEWFTCDPNGDPEGELEDICEKIEGVEGSYYVPVADDTGSYIVARVTVDTGFGDPATAEAGPAGPVMPADEAPNTIVGPSISGNAYVGAVLTADPGEWTGYPPPTFSYQWQRETNDGKQFVDIPGAMSKQYALQEADEGRKIRVAVTAKNGVPTDKLAYSDPIGPVTPAPEAPENTETPSISGQKIAGETITVDPGKWSGYPPPTFSYQWQLCDENGKNCADIEAETASAYTIKEDEVGKTLKALVTAKNSEGENTTVAGPTGKISPASEAPKNTESPSISGEAYVGEILQGDPGEWTGYPEPSLSLRWKRCNENGESCANIPGATDDSYQLIESDNGKTIKFAVTANNGAGGPVTATSEAAGPVEKKQASVVWSPDKYDFGLLAVGAKSPTKLVRLENIGQSSATLGALKLEGKDADNFEIVENECASGAKLEPGKTCTVKVVFVPKSAGKKSAKLSIPSTAVTVPGGVHELDLSGEGAPGGGSGGGSSPGADDGSLVTLSPPPAPPPAPKPDKCVAAKTDPKKLKKAKQAVAKAKKAIKKAMKLKRKARGKQAKEKAGSKLNKATRSLKKALKAYFKLDKKAELKDAEKVVKKAKKSLEKAKRAARKARGKLAKKKTAGKLKRAKRSFSKAKKRHAKLAAAIKRQGCPA